MSDYFCDKYIFNAWVDPAVAEKERSCLPAVSRGTVFLSSVLRDRDQQSSDLHGHVVPPYASVFLPVKWYMADIKSTLKVYREQLV